MQKHPMLSVKEAAEALKLDERSIRERLANGTLKGEKKAVGNRDKWFVYKSALDSALEKQANQDLPISESTSAPSEAGVALSAPEGIFEEYMDAEITSRQEPSATPRGEWYTDDRDRLESIIEKVMKPLVDKVAMQASVLAEQERLIQEQKVQLRLLPDLEKRAEDERKAAELKELEAIALQKQMDAIAEEKSKALQLKEAEMQAQLQKLEAERLKADVLEGTITELQQSKANLEASLQGEIESLKTEKDAQAKAVQDQLSVLTEKLAKLEKKSWWQKFFAAPSEQE